MRVRLCTVHKLRRPADILAEMAKYDALANHLAALPRGQNRVTLTFAKIEQLLGLVAGHPAALPPSAYAYEDWWRGGTRWSRVVQIRAWERAGWVAEDLNLRARLVTFRRQT